MHDTATKKESAVAILFSELSRKWQQRKRLHFCKSLQFPQDASEKSIFLPKFLKMRIKMSKRIVNFEDLATICTIV